MIARRQNRVASSNHGFDHGEVLMRGITPSTMMNRDMHDKNSFASNGVQINVRVSN